MINCNLYAQFICIDKLLKKYMREFCPADGMPSLMPSLRRTLTPRPSGETSCATPPTRRAKLVICQQCNFKLPRFDWPAASRPSWFGTSAPRLHLNQNQNVQLPQNFGCMDVISHSSTVLAALEHLPLLSMPQLPRNG